MVITKVYKSKAIQLATSAKLHYWKQKAVAIPCNLRYKFGSRSIKSCSTAQSEVEAKAEVEKNL